MHHHRKDHVMITCQVPDARLTADVRLGDAGGKSVANIRVASNARVKDPSSGEWTSEGIFLDVALWRSAETVAEYFHKGSPIIVWGELRPRHWTDRDGVTRDGWELSQADWTFPPKASENGGAQPAAQQQSRPAAQRPASQTPKPADPDDEFKDLF
jgi:single-strand DNA-binding protein